MKNGLQLLKAEWKAIFKNKVALISIIAVCFIPIIYTGTYLAAFWDPYAKMDTLPVAVVNQDQGANFHGEKLEIGNEFVKKLKANQKFDWQFVNAEKGQKGLDDQKYYMMVTIPKDFSKNATTVLDENPKQLNLIYTANEGFNFLSAQIGNSAIEILKVEISKTLTKTYINEMLTSVSKIGEGMQAAADGSKTLSNGITTASEGSKTLESGLVTFSSKMQLLKEGLKKAKAGNGQISEGLVQLNKNGTLLINGLKQYADGSGQLSYNLGVFGTKIGGAYDGAKQVEKGLNDLSLSIQTVTIPEPYATAISGSLLQLKGASQSVSNSLNSMNTSGTKLSVSDPDLANKLVTIKNSADSAKLISGSIPAGLTQLQSQATALLPTIPEPNRTLLANGLANLIAGSMQVDAGLGQLSKASADLQVGAVTFVQKTAELNAGSIQFLTGLNQVSNGVSQLDAGAAQLLDGSTQLQSGSEQLKEGSASLNSGMTQLDDGGKELTSKLASGADEVRTSIPGENSIKMMASPVNAKVNHLNEVSNYGTGFAPYFIALGLFVGGLVLSIVFSYRKSVGIPTSGWSLFVSKFGVIAVASAFQSVVVTLVMLLGLGLEVKNVLAFFVTILISSITYVSLVYMFVTLFNDAGRFMVILLLILQLTTCAGTFPLELIPDWFQAINPLLPMTYTVSAFKDVISIGDMTHWLESIIVLLVFFAVSIGIALAFLNVKVKSGFGINENVSV